MSEMSPELREFVVSRFSSLEQVEVFVLLYENPERQWAPEMVATELKMAPESARMRLFLLSSVGLLASAGSLEVFYWYAGAPALDALAKELRAVYESDRPALAAVVERGGLRSSARQFADAFRLKKP